VGKLVVDDVYSADFIFPEVMTKFGFIRKCFSRRNISVPLNLSALPFWNGL